MTDKSKVVYFDHEKLATMKRSQLQSLAKRTKCAKANQPSGELRSALKDYYSANQAAIKRKGDELQKKKKEGKNKRRKISNELDSTLHWVKGTSID